MAVAKKTPKDETPSERSLLMPLLQLAFVVAAAVIVYSFVSVAKEGESRRRCSASCILHPEYMGADRRMPSVTLHDLKGGTVNLDQYRGKVVFLNFWTKTCGPCLEEMPEIALLSQILKSRSDVVVIAVSTDESAKDASEAIAAVLPLVKKLIPGQSEQNPEPPFTVLIDPDAEIVSGKFGTHLFPETWIVDKRGVIRARFDGKREWSNAAVVEFIDEIREGGYCPMEVKAGHESGEGAKVCEALRGT